MPAFTYPLAWIAAITLPTLAAIYFLRHRFRRQQVSSLLLWQIHQESREGGTPKGNDSPILGDCVVNYKRC